MTTSVILPVSNTGKTSVEIAVEPEGRVVALQPGKRCEVRFLLQRTEEFDLEVDIEDNLLLLYCSSTKEVWQDGLRVDAP